MSVLGAVQPRRALRRCNDLPRCTSSACPPIGPPMPLTLLRTPARPVKMVWLKMYDPVKPQPMAPDAMLDRPAAAASGGKVFFLKRGG